MMSFLVPDTINIETTVEYAALLFLIVFVLIVLRAFHPINRQHFKEVAELPLRDDISSNYLSIQSKRDNHE